MINSNSFVNCGVCILTKIVGILDVDKRQHYFDGSMKAKNEENSCFLLVHPLPFTSKQFSADSAGNSFCHKLNFLFHFLVGIKDWEY